MSNDTPTTFTSKVGSAVLQLTIAAAGGAGAAQAVISQHDAELRVEITQNACRCGQRKKAEPGQQIDLPQPAATSNDNTTTKKVEFNQPIDLQAFSATPYVGLANTGESEADAVAKAQSLVVNFPGRFIYHAYINGMAYVRVIPPTTEADVVAMRGLFTIVAPGRPVRDSLLPAPHVGHK